MLTALKSANSFFIPPLKRGGLSNFDGTGKSGEISSNNRIQPEMALLSLLLLQMCVVYINTLMIQQVLSEPEWLNRLNKEDFRGLTPLICGHINPYGIFLLDLSKRLQLKLVS